MFSLYFCVFSKLSPGQYFCNQENCPASVQSLSHVRLFATPRIAARQASPSITNSRSLLKLLSIELVMPSNRLILMQCLSLPKAAHGCFSLLRIITRKGNLKTSSSDLQLCRQFSFLLLVSYSFITCLLVSFLKPAP